MTLSPCPEQAPAKGRLLRLARWVPAAAAVLIALWYGGRWAVWARHDAAATERLGKRDFDAALDHLAWCRRAYPRDAKTWLRSAQAARRAGRHEQAQEWLDAAEKLGARASWVRREAALLAAQRGRFAEVEDALHQMLRTSGDEYPVVAEVLTAEYMRAGRYAEARALLDRWVEMRPDDEEGWLRRAWTAEHQFQFRTALEDYQRVLELAPDRDPVRVRLAEIHLQARRPADAAEQLRPLSERRPDDPEVAALTARCRREMGDLDGAAAALDALPEKDRDAPKALAERGHLALARGEPAAAEGLLRRAQRGLPRSRDLLFALQQALSRQGKTAEAEKAAEALKQADADGRRMGEVMAALRGKPGDAKLRYEAAGIFERNGLPEDAARWLRLALEADPRHAEAHERLAALYEAEGKAKEAEAHRAAAARLRGEK